MNNSIPKQTGASTFERSDASEVNSLRRSLIRSSLLALGSVKLMAACVGGGGGGASGLSEIQLSRNTPERFLSPGGRSKRTPLPQAPVPEPPSLTTLGPLPSWVPSPGDVSTLTQSNGRLTNTFGSICAPYYEPFYFRKINNDFSTYVVNPYWGTYGALIGFGGGHAATNDNSVWALDIGQTNCTFKRLSTPSPIFGSTPADATTNSISNLTSEQWDVAWGEYTIDGQPAAPHSYSALDILPPASGGGACGSLIEVMGSAKTHGSSAPICVPHQIDFPSTAGATGSYTWARRANIQGTVDFGGYLTTHVPSQQRVYIEGGSSVNSPRWFDLNTNTFARSTGTASDITARGGSVADATDNYAMFHVLERNLLVLMMGTNPSGYMRVQTLDTTQTNPSWVTRNLNAPLAVTGRWQAACWCPDNSRIIVGSAFTNLVDRVIDNAAAYEIEIPVVLSNPWTVTRAPFGAGQTITWPAEGQQTYKKWSYNPLIKAILYMPYAGDGTDEIVWVYRPRNT